jgi:transcription-repair coupling factor (superfamily II helicase)
VSEGRRLAGIDHWLPLFEERLATLLDHLSPDDILVRDAGDAGAAEARFEAVSDYYQNRVRAQSNEPGSYRPLEPGSLYFDRAEWERTIADRPLHLVSSFHEPDGAGAIDFAVDPARDFAPERTQNANVYEAVAEHVSALQRQGKKVVLASYSVGARERLKGLLEDHGLRRRAGHDWQGGWGCWNRSSLARGERRGCLTVIQLDHWLHHRDIALLTEQDMLGDRLSAAGKRKKSTEAFSPSWRRSRRRSRRSCRSRYRSLRGPDSDPRPEEPARLRAPFYAGGDKLYVPVENIDVLCATAASRKASRSTSSAAKPGSVARHG